MGASLAEMASMNPTVGAQYRWTSKFAPPRLMTPAFWGLLQGWITVGAWISVVAQPAFLLGTNIQGLLIFNDETYVPQRWQGTLLAWAVLAVPVLVNIFARRLLPSIEVIGGITHIVFFIAWIAVLVTLAPRSSAEFVFESSVFGLSGWSNEGVQWCVGLLSAVFPLGGFDGVLHVSDPTISTDFLSSDLCSFLLFTLACRSHLSSNDSQMSDEVKNAPRKVPQAMMYSLLIGGAMQLGFMITILFCLGPVETALETPTGYPIIQVMYGATKNKAATIVMLVFVLFNGMVAMFSSLASVSRLTWAFGKQFH